MTQAELDAGTAIVNTATVTGTGATPDSDDATVPVAQSKILHIEKDARLRAARRTSTGDDDHLHAGGDQPGNAAIAGVVVRRSVHDQRGAGSDRRDFNVGDTDQDNLLDVGETWQYTASHTVTQAELDAGAAIVNTATVTGTGATPDTDDATVTVAQSKVLHIEKDATVAGGTADSTGDDHQLHAGGDQHGQCGDRRCGGETTRHDQRGAGADSAAFNGGDTDQDDLLDVGETWQLHGQPSR